MRTCAPLKPCRPVPATRSTAAAVVPRRVRRATRSQHQHNVRALQRTAADSLQTLQRPAGDSWKHDKFDTPDSSSSSPRDPPSKGSTADQGPSNKLVIRNLHYEVSERELEVRPLSLLSPTLSSSERASRLTLDLSAASLRADRPDGQRAQDQSTAALPLPPVHAALSARGAGSAPDLGYTLARPDRLRPASPSLRPSPLSPFFTIVFFYTSSRSSTARDARPARPGSPTSRTSTPQRPRRRSTVRWLRVRPPFPYSISTSLRSGADELRLAGEPIEVDFDYRNDRPSERGAAAPGSLLARLGGTECVPLSLYPARLISSASLTRSLVQVGCSRPQVRRPDSWSRWRSRSRTSRRARLGRRTARRSSRR